MAVPVRLNAEPDVLRRGAHIRAVPGAQRAAEPYLVLWHSDRPLVSKRRTAPSFIAQDVIGVAARARRLAGTLIATAEAALLTPHCECTLKA